jgi:hypothetical protein
VRYTPGMAMEQPGAYRYCGRAFSAAEIERIRSLIASNPAMHRVALSQAVCDALGWVRPDGRRKEMSCRVAMLRMHRAGLICLPPPRHPDRNRGRGLRLTRASDPEFPLSVPAGQLGELDFRVVGSRSESSLWNELIGRYHYLGYKPLPGAQMRFLVFGRSQLLGALGFGASAWKVAPRDRWIGWTAYERSKNLHLVVNNARFLILPWITSRNLASRILAGVVRALPCLWEQRYGFRPVLLETFVDRDRFRGTCYRAANWIHVGQTQGRGKLDRKHEYALPVKDVFLLPLRKDFREQLRMPPQTAEGT